jgi:hypothetical protein
MDELDPLALPGLWADVLLSRLGMRRVLGTDDVRILQRDRAAALALPRAIVAAFRRFFAADDFERPRPLRPGYDWPWISEALSSPWSADAFAGRVVGELGPGEVAELEAAADRVRTYLLSIAPTDRRPIGPRGKPAPAPEGAAAAFRRAWDVADDPTVVTDDLAGGILTRGQVRDLHACYPALGRYVHAAAFSALSQRLQRSPRYQVPYDQDRALAALLGRVSWPPGVGRDLQAAITAEAQRAGQPRQPPPGPVEAGADSARTPAQRVAAM